MEQRGKKGGEENQRGVPNWKKERRRIPSLRKKKTTWGFLGGEKKHRGGVRSTLPNRSKGQKRVSTGGLEIVPKGSGVVLKSQTKRNLGRKKNIQGGTSKEKGLES